MASLFDFLTVFLSAILSRITRKTSNDPHVSKIDNKTDCSLDNIDNSDEEIKLPNDILEALERQDEGSKPNIEELEIINLTDDLRGLMALLLGGGYSACREPLDQGMAKLVMVYQDEW
jgi:hypothetical protein